MRSIVLPVLACVVGACRSPSLEAVRPERVAIDDLIQINANVCTKPAADALFPVKVLMVVDTSASMGVTDRDQVRARAVTSVLQRFQGNPGVQFGVIAFDAEVIELTDGFTNSPNLAEISNRLSVADRLTDYQGALGAAYAMISQDMQNASPAERARSKYMVIFFTDGVPDPQCSANMPDARLVCDYAREDWVSVLGLPTDQVFPGLTGGADYNQPAQIYKSIDDIVALQDAYRVGDVRVHTALLFPEGIDDALIAAFGLDRAAASALLTGIADHGHGTFTEFTAATQISFLNFDYTSVKEPDALADFLVSNSNSIYVDSQLDPDTDGDGLSDAEEFELHSCVGITAKCATPADSDGDSYSDLFEAKFKASGFDLNDRTKPATQCRARGDSDGDGLKDCEEQFLGTDNRLFDSDSDRLTDYQELRYGLNPLDPNDATADADNDGMRNIDEIRAHLDPNKRNAADGDTFGRYTYSVDKTETRPDGRICYQSTVQNVRLVTTGTGTDSPRGASRIMLQFIEAPTSRPLDFGALRIACVDVRYIENALKSPASGIIELTDDNFVSPTAFDPNRDCVKADAP